MTSQILSQDEVDALLQGISSADDGLSADHDGTESPKTCDLSDQERIVRGRMPHLEVVNERFARNLVVELARAPATVEQLLGMAPGDFIELDLGRGVQAKVAGVPVLACNYGVSNGKYALKVDQLLAGSTSSWIGEQHA